MSELPSDEVAALCREVLGLDLPRETLGSRLAAFAAILREISKLRELDLSEAHPAVVFDPAAARPEDGDGG